MVFQSSRFHDGKSGSALTIKVTPNSEINELTEITEDGTLLIKLATFQDKMDENTALIKFLGLMVDVAENQIEIIAGEGGTDKLVAILDLDPSELHKRIMNYWHNP